MNKTIAAALAAATLLPAAASAADLTPVDLVNRHMAAAAKGDVDAIVADYADDAVAITAGNATQGKAALHAMFAGMLGGGGNANGPKPVFKNLKVWQQGDVGFVTWEMNSGAPNAVRGTDAFLVKNGKIQVQSVFIGGQQPTP